MGSGCAVEGLNESSHCDLHFGLSEALATHQHWLQSVAARFRRNGKWFRGQFIGFDGMKPVHGLASRDATCGDIASTGTVINPDLDGRTVANAVSEQANGGQYSTSADYSPFATVSSREYVTAVGAS